MALSPKSFTITWSGIANVLKSEIYVSRAFREPGDQYKLTSECKLFSGIWDTGASGTAISQRVVSGCGLVPIGIAEVHTANGLRRCNTYLANLWLPNKVVIPEVLVTEAELATDCDILVGMNIINLGDFAVTNLAGKTVLSYRFPSVQSLDFVKNPFKIAPKYKIPTRKK